MTRDRRFKQRVRRRMLQTGERYTAALAAEQETRPPPRSPKRSSADKMKEDAMQAKPAVPTRLRGVWLGVEDLERSRAFYERIGAYFDERQPDDGILYATLAGIRLSLERSQPNPQPGAGFFLLFDVTDADALYEELQDADCKIVGPPRNDPWGRQFNVHDPDGYAIAFLGPVR